MAKLVRSINLDEATWGRLDVEAHRRGVSRSALISIIVNDQLNPKDPGMVVDLFKSLSQVATLGLAPWKQTPKPTS